MTNCCGLIIIVNLFMEEHLGFQASVPTLLPKTLTNKEEAGGGDKKKKKNEKKKKNTESRRKDKEKPGWEL